MKKLINRPSILENESLSSYLYRLSRENHFESPISFANGLDIKWFHFYTNKIDFESCKRISSICDYNSRELFNLSLNYFEECCEDDVKKIGLLKTFVKYCPLCIKDNTYHSRLWCFNPISICIKHKNFLVDKCSGCSYSIKFDQYMKGFCEKCNFIFNQANPQILGENSLIFHSQEEIQSIFNNKNGTVFREMNFYELLYVIKKHLILIEDLQCTITGEPIKIAANFQYFDNRNFSNALANIYWIYKDFPRNFFSTLDQFFDLPFERRRRRKKEFEKIFKNEKFTFIKEAYTSYMAQQIESGNVPRNVSAFDANASKKVRKKYIQKKQIQEQFSLTVKETIEFCKSLTPKIFRHGKVKICQYEVEEVKAKIKTFLDFKEDLITKKEAAKIVGLNVDQIPLLIEEGFLKEINFMSKKFISQKKLIILQKSFRIKRKCEDDSFISYNRLFDQYVTSGISVVKIIRELKSGNISAHITSESLRICDFRFSREDIKKLLEKIKMEKTEVIGYNLSQVSRKLDMGEKTVHKLIKHQFITPFHEEVSEKGKKTILFKKDEIDDFCRTFITVSEASKLFDKRPNYFRSLVHKGKLKNYLRGICLKVLMNRQEMFQLMNARG